MIVLAEGAPASFGKKYAGNPHVGHLLTPRSLNVRQVLESGLPWGVDCESVRGFEPDRYLCLLERLTDPETDSRNCKFWTLTELMETPLKSADLPLAMVLHPSTASVVMQMFGSFLALVLAGDARWRQENLALAILVKQAREAGKWVHARDVCSSRQARAMAKLGCSSCSLPHYARFNYAKFEPLAEAAELATQEPSLFGS
jgi:hypothetical protein